MSTDVELIRRKFERIGARAKTHAGWFRIDINKDRKGDYFDIGVPNDSEVSVEVIDVRRDLRHLLLLVRQLNSKDKVLCGHDERHWFAATLLNVDVSNVLTALAALKPREVQLAERRKGIRTRDRLRRRNQAFIRQGEWFFVPAPNLYVNKGSIHYNEPLSRAPGSKPHMCEQVCRFELPGAGWWVRPQDYLKIFARGRVWHPDHKTVFLEDWHRVFLNTQSRSMGGNGFLD
ncbi:MAG: hypothetical protein WAV20_04770 [Blastocatellia bacterium]